MGILESLKNGLIVSCQAYEDEYLFSDEIMARMALCAEEGGAAGIRANSVKDIESIKSRVALPLIGLWKQNYPGSDVYITPTVREADAVLQAGADIVAVDATMRIRPNGENLEDIIRHVRNQYSCLIMADISTLEEGIYAEQLGFDMISTTLSGYTPYSRQLEQPDFQLIHDLCAKVSIPVFAEGRIQSPEQALHCFEQGAFAVVIGGAITRPQQITRNYVNRIDDYTNVKSRQG